MTGESTKGREFEIMQQVAELVDTLRPEQQRQVMAMLFARYEMKVVRVTSESKRGFRYAPRSKPKR